MESETTRETPPRVRHVVAYWSEHGDPAADLRLACLHAEEDSMVLNSVVTAPGGYYVYVFVGVEVFAIPEYVESVLEAALDEPE